MARTMMSSRCPGILLTVVLVFTLSAGLANAEFNECSNNDLIEVSVPNDETLNEICLAAAKAITFLAKYQLHPKRVIRIEIVETEINSRGYIAYGSYDRQRDLIQLMSLQAVLNNGKSPQMYDQPFDREHYHGAVAHEVTHAVFQHNARNIKDQLTNVAQEYLAHSTQLGVLSDERRNQIVEASDVGPWESGDLISDVYMGLKPTGFAVKSYQHLTQMEDPQPFIKLLLNNNWFYLSVP